jgi:hypothetical protein
VTSLSIGLELIRLGIPDAQIHRQHDCIHILMRTYGDAYELAQQVVEWRTTASLTRTKHDDYKVLVVIPFNNKNK